VTPSLFDLPVRLGDAVLLAPLVMDQRVFTDDVRKRIASRAGALRFDALKPYYGSLERDPVHPDACYICVDGVDGAPLLLRFAPASTPSSGLFPKSILIGRTFIGPREVVINAIPFGPSDEERIRVFASEVNRVYRGGGDEATWLAIRAGKRG